MECSRGRAKELFNSKNYQGAILIYNKLWESVIDNGKIDVWLGWEYAKSLKQVGALDEAIGICKTIYKEDASFKYNKDLLSWCLYEKYFKNLKTNEELNNKEQIIKIADFITHITQQEPNLPYEKIVWKIIKLYKNPFNDYQINKWLDKLNVNILEDEAISINVNNKNIELASNKEDWYYLKCKVLNKFGKYQECIEVCDTAISNIKKFHNDRDIWIERKKAESIAMLGEKEKAVSLLRKLLLKREHWTVYQTIFQIEAELKNYDVALLSAYTAALTKDASKGKVNLYFEIGCVLESKGEFKYALMHYLFSKKIREENGWKIPDKLNNCINILMKKESIDLDKLHIDLKNFWLNEKVKSKERYEGTIFKLLPNGKAGFIKSDNYSYYFNIYSIMKDRSSLRLNKKVSFSLIDSYDRKKDINTKEAVDILMD